MATVRRRYIIAIANGFIATKPLEPDWYKGGPVASLRYAKEQAKLDNWKDILSAIAFSIKEIDPEFSESEFMSMVKSSRRVKDDA